MERTWWGGGADAQPFFDVGLPTLYFATTEGYGHLHQSSDRGETLNQNLFLASARLAFLTAAAVANGEYQPEQRQSRQEAPG